MDYEEAVYEALGAGRPDIALVYATLAGTAHNTTNAIDEQRVKAHLARAPPMLTVATLPAGRVLMAREKATDRIVWPVPIYFDPVTDTIATRRVYQRCRRVDVVPAEEVEQVIPLIEAVQQQMSGSAPGAFKFGGKWLDDDAEEALLVLIGQLPNLHRALEGKKR